MLHKKTIFLHQLIDENISFLYNTKYNICKVWYFQNSKNDQPKPNKKIVKISQLSMTCIVDIINHHWPLNVLTILVHAVSILFKMRVRVLSLRRQWSVAGIQAVWKRQINMLLLPLSFYLSSSCPNREPLSLFLAQLSHQLNIGIDFQSSASVAACLRNLRRASHRLFSVTGLQRCMHFWRWNRSIRSIPRQFCAEIVQSCRNLRFLRFLPRESGIWRGTRTKYCWF